MTTYLLPKRGVGNSVTFTNNFTVTKDAPVGDQFSPPPNAWTDGGGDTFDESGPMVMRFPSYGTGTSNLYIRAAFNTADTVMTFGMQGIPSDPDRASMAYVSGWATDGIWCLENHWGGSQPGTYSFYAPTGYDGPVIMSVLKTPYVIDGTTYELTSGLWTTSIITGPSTEFNVTHTGTGYGWSLSNNNTTLSLAPNNTLSNGIHLTNRPVSSGKWYWEIAVPQLREDILSVSIGLVNGFAISNYNMATSSYVGVLTGTHSYSNDGVHRMYYGVIAYRAPFVSGDVISIALDADTQQIWYGKNGVWLYGDPSTATGGVSTGPDFGGGAKAYPAVSLLSSTTLPTSVTFNSTTASFAYTAPTGFSPISDAPELLTPLNNETYLSYTFVPYRASDNLAGQNPVQYSIFGSDGAYVTATVNEGFTVYVSWGKSNPHDLHTWIINDLVKSVDFANPPNPALAATNWLTLPGNVKTYSSAENSIQKVTDYTVNPVMPRPTYLWSVPYTGRLVPVPINTTVTHRPRDVQWNRDQLTAPTLWTGRVSGTVMENSVAVGGAIVRLYRRETGTLIDAVRTDTDGHFTFYLLDPSISNYYVVALDPDSGVQYNAKIFDRLTPYVGAPI
jgi:hypothetical protein